MGLIKIGLAIKTAYYKNNTYCFKTKIIKFYANKLLINYMNMALVCLIYPSRNYFSQKEKNKNQLG